MSYPKVLALLDAQLDRLRAAREILSSGTASNGDAEELTHLPEIAAGINTQENEADGTLPDAVVQPTRVKPKQRRERRVVVRRAKQDAAGALGSAVPKAPVYVSAEKAQSVRPKNGAAQAPKQEEQLSPELLARRWLQTSAN